MTCIAERSTKSETWFRQQTFADVQPAVSVRTCDFVVKSYLYFLGRCYLLNDFSHNRMTGLAIKIVE